MGTLPANVPEPKGPKYALICHGGVPDPSVVAVNPELATLTVPENFRIVYFYDPTATQNLTTMSCTQEIANWCIGSNKKRWVYEEGTYKGRFQLVQFESDGSMGFYACPSRDEVAALVDISQNVKKLQERDSVRPTRLSKKLVLNAVKLLHDEAVKSSPQVVSSVVTEVMTLTDVLRMASDQLKPTEPITIYIVMCSASSTLRSTRGVVLFTSGNVLGFNFQSAGNRHNRRVRHSRRRTRSARTRSARTRSARTRSARTRSARTRRSHS